jgi:nicotinate-nucleotide pyrophosphorylase (carboxylating)
MERQLTTSHQINQLICQALAEDLGHGDATTNALIPGNQTGKALIIAKAKGTIAGTQIAKQVFLTIDQKLKINILIHDGTIANAGDVIAIIEGKCASILKAERVALNFLQHLSGVATETKQYVKALKGLTVQILDTRKTIPGLRALEKYAVKAGGGKNHRMSLEDAILIKDNHLVSLRSQRLTTKDIITRARQKAPKNMRIEIEAKTPDEADEAANAGADIIMLDNMSLAEMRRAVQLIKGRSLIEASGGITIDKIRAIAETGVDFISVGALTHSPKALDISLELET